MKQLFFGFVFFASCIVAVQAQDILNHKLKNSDEGKALIQLLNDLHERQDVRFYFLPDWIDDFKIQAGMTNRPLGQVLDILFEGTGLGYIAMHDRAIVIVKDPTSVLQRKLALQEAVDKNKKISEVIIGSRPLSAISVVNLKGTITDAKSGKLIPQAEIYLNAMYATRTDNFGNFHLAVSQGKMVLNLHAAGYDEKVIDLEVLNDGELNISLDERSTQLEEVVVQSQSLKESPFTRVGEIKLSVLDMKMTPSLMGEVDLVRQIQNLPGVTTVGEAAAGFNVRGGSVDQNIVLYDALPVFNTSHAFGFLTAFNPDAVSDVTFYKGGIPAEYGGRTASVLDIRSRDGDYTKWGGRAGIGMLTSNFMVNGPLRKEKTSLAVSFRSTYSNWLMHSVRSNYSNLENSSLFFYDGTFKLAHKISNRTKLTFTGYSSRDAFRLTGDTTYRWSNFLNSAILDHAFSSKFSTEIMAGVSSFGYSVLNQEVRTASDLRYRITTVLSKIIGRYKFEAAEARMGAEVLYYDIRPGSLTPNSTASNAAKVSLDKKNSLELAIFGSLEKSWNNLYFDVGIRVPSFTTIGAAKIRLYQAGQPRDLSTQVGTKEFDRFERIKTYVGVEPRLSFRVNLNGASSVKVGYNRIYQFLHLITNTTAVTPIDVWQPSDYYFKPQHADQISLGYFRDSPSKKYSASLEGFYKRIQNILDFKDAAQLVLNEHLETDIVQGKGRAFGLEFSIAKNFHKFTWSVNYTLSRTFRTFNSPFQSEQINRGKEYPSNYDQPHIINASWKVNLSRRHFFTGNFTYRTGRPVTVPLSVFEFENTTIAYFSGRNQYRIPDYHRLDLALVIEGNHKRRKIGSGTWVLSVYNVYARKNPYSIFFKGSLSGIPKPYQLSIVGTLFPSINYTIKF